MSRKNNKIILIGIIVLMVLFYKSVPLLANRESKTITVGLNTINVVVNGKEINQSNILYDDTTYVPLRLISEMTGKVVNWDAKTYTASIDDNSDSQIDVEFDNGDKILNKEFNKNIKVNLNRIKVVIYGEEIKGNNILYNDTTYVPLRLISEKIGNTVEWDPSLNAAKVYGGIDLALEFNKIYESEVNMYRSRVDLYLNTIDFMEEAIIAIEYGMDVSDSLNRMKYFVNSQVKGPLYEISIHNDFEVCHENYLNAHKSLEESFDFLIEASLSNRYGNYNRSSYYIDKSLKSMSDGKKYISVVINKVYPNR